MLVRVVAPHFVAGLEVERCEDGEERCVYAAPILRWAVGKTRIDLQEYFRRSGWKASVVATD
jgi:hypothetical protein